MRLFCHIGRFCFGCLNKIWIRECKVFGKKIAYMGGDFPENRRLDLAFPYYPGITFAPKTEMTV